MRSGLIACAFFALAGLSAWAEPQSDAQRLRACIEKIDSDPEDAYEDGLAWMSIGAPPAARHCVALALVGIGHYAEGAARLETLANDKDAGTIEARGVYLAQAGNAWILARNPEAALVALDNAVKLMPTDGALRTDLGRAYLLLKDLDAAGREFDAAIELSPGDPDALRYRAKVLLEQGRLEDAWHDVVGSLAQAPDNVESLLLRGQIREAMRVKGLPDPEQG